ncbi:Eco57I restriction-modification methylase domain-containing protein [Mycoplasma bradburyae]|uniref:site-specific DNA-methyltransferase (adenine-specific) n=1 Tax=Mycoplasma bradburyae TaxID=2963128 RepID=A0AAW6HSQ7_9MOLU|nr:N-6 DNA methylase [Mycoplasma bradburyae]MDC4163486.1 SAM-dependent methyltransferase [Mycoplasma bradburyae]MDC4182088.1 SAM-dependent methyltransferase [Mycoplasma bradburyae]MDC4183535.1 SAM-dependent methyltransferase [Mycoplasma bradburyae]MDC4184274.1 SAM-dependent methyltransferase [Mycoplasma bradburyae]UTS69838.1 SAM-dependent methyltransferase [Mycoplasma bradburyae]
MNKELLGQVFTPKTIVDKMINLITISEPELVLEPSSGSGNFYYELIKKYKNVIGVEIDKSVAHKNAVIKSYFETTYKPDIIIGNPPYVDFKNITVKPSNSILIHKPNLYLYFLEKALSDLKENGELIWIVPAAIFTTSSSNKLNEIIYKNYSITYFELIPENVWDNASVPTAIVKIIKSKDHKDKLDYFLANGKIIFGKKPKIKSSIVVKVGGASGFNSKLKEGDLGFVVSTTERTKELKKILYEPKKWIRAVPKPPKEFTYQIFVNCKTRNKRPFYILDYQKESEFINYDASVLSLFVNVNKDETLKIVNQLNNMNWELMGIKRDGRFHFSQSILTAIFEK